jgi:hypothetical protein
MYYALPGGDPEMPTGRQFLSIEGPRNSGASGNVVSAT